MIKRRIATLVLVVFAVVCVCLVITYQRAVHNHQALETEMNRVVRSSEAHAEIEKFLKNRDPNALTDKGKIRSYAIDYSTVRLNPMGGVMFTLYVNDNPDIYVSVTLDKDTDFNTYSLTTATSNEFQKLVKE